jgi:hypothetical protein
MVRGLKSFRGLEACNILPAAFRSRWCGIIVLNTCGPNRIKVVIQRTALMRNHNSCIRSVPEIAREDFNAKVVKKIFSSLQFGMRIYV